METPKAQISALVQKQKAFFATQQTKAIDFRLKQLSLLKQAILKHQPEIEEALWKDLHKSKEEVYLTEISIVLSEINYHLKKIKSWARPKRVWSPISVLPASSRIIYEPLGVALIISPWNYPFQLLINPLVGAISSGCCALLKASPDAPNLANVVEKMLTEYFPLDYIALVKGGRETNTYLLEERFDFIFFTGSPSLGKVVMKAAAENLTPIVLELGGKSPCIVDKDANLNLAAKRIAWGKLINAGQTCIAPDYLWVHRSVKKELLEKIAYHIKEMYGSDVKSSLFYPRIVNDKSVERLSKFLNEGNIYLGGEVDSSQKYIAPTIINNVEPHFAIMQEEIFGPLLPVITFDHIDEPISYINQHEKPLALYYFGKTKTAKEVISKTSSGGGCINDTLMHIANHHLPFGGVGNSGMGKYHGKYSFLAFSNERAIVKTPTFLDLPFKYVPFKFFKWVKKLI
ncbi:aldehyde dehydrogenase [Riemerella anatipestifer]|uniref:Aldehyde dehydrogenase n=1 Tax=Riemerella anatipestifer TaxID=34085 RepID=A0AAP6HEE2_RIEAN|nr:aldehyde dehydrogenase [Riemerella anatipestifer]MBT0549408.1 aldehyde dehydrogenase [Riemerella anatipestifer]MBT0555969.1 aldehyde dehydrogenase [Riemerella anatipestifer]MBT0560171.1 aldehyde dehydrogenase [Riemerella anatipestifer]MCD5968468.1 aldehyde dehydrogenase [Riemerella anatipestifer]MCU7540823.1 aldehyde dehydrogenase [Riemerella anatipestifer]